MLKLKAGKSPLVANMWKAGSLAMLVELWRVRNRMKYDGIQTFSQIQGIRKSESRKLWSLHFHHLGRHAMAPIPMV
ncbi:hypothetical protein FRX31_032460 [Thalictrum thalictroides]|uniref:Uncharacterized protein n=1 Tax=Thalictrum thalictroides TaxID=46969 RepID=A0A7J6UZ54_THATH|nr:hypothetical protein FRX31_032460 [Thalictrum thalictroides]